MFFSSARCPSPRVTISLAQAEECGGVNDLGRNQEKRTCLLAFWKGGEGVKENYENWTKTKTLEGYPISLQISSFPLSPNALAKTPLGPVVSATFTSFVPKAKMFLLLVLFFRRREPTFKAQILWRLNTYIQDSLPLTNDGGKLKSSQKSNLKDIYSPD